MATKNGAAAAQLTSKVETVTPALAEAWLATMQHNRRLSSNTVERLAKMMKEGQWLFDGAPLRFNTKGELVDGQHRLWALIEAKYTADFLVVRNVPDEAFLTMDTGKNRSFADMLSIETPGLGDVNNVAATTQIACRWDLGMRGRQLIAGRAGTLTNSQLMTYYRQHSEHIINASKLARAGKLTGIPGRALDLLAHIALNLDAEDAAFFFQRLHDGVGLEETSPILALRNTAQAHRGGRGYHTDLPADVACALVIKAWNAYREGHELTKLNWRRGGANPEMFPEPR